MTITGKLDGTGVLPLAAGRRLVQSCLCRRSALTRLRQPVAICPPFQACASVIPDPVCWRRVGVSAAETGVSVVRGSCFRSGSSSAVVMSQRYKEPVASDPGPYAEVFALGVLLSAARGRRTRRPNIRVDGGPVAPDRIRELRDLGLLPEPPPPHEIHRDQAARSADCVTIVVPPRARSPNPALIPTGSGSRFGP